MRFGSRFTRSACAVAIFSTLSAHGGAQSSTRRPFDAIYGVVGDRVILESQIDKDFRDSYGDQDLPPAKVREARDSIVRAIAADEIWVQVGKVIGRENPEEFETQIQAMVSDYMQEQEEKFGSLTKMNEELKLVEKSWKSLADEHRNEILRETAQQMSIQQRFQLYGGSQFVITPREMLEFYRENQQHFAAENSADLAWVSFAKEAPDAATRAAQAAAAWRDEPVGAAEIAARFGGIALALNGRVRDEAADPRKPFLKAFARDGKEGDVLDPTDGGAGPFLYVVKIVAKTEQDEKAFTAPDVQQRIKQFLLNRKLAMVQEHILRFKARQILVYPPHLAALIDAR